MPNELGRKGATGRVGSQMDEKVVEVMWGVRYENTLMKEMQEKVCGDGDRRYSCQKKEAIMKIFRSENELEENEAGNIRSVGGATTEEDE